MDFLNTPLVKLFGYNIYPLFFILVILIPLAIIITVVIKNSQKNKLPEEAKNVKIKRLNNDVVKQTLEDGNSNNQYNIISAWQKENITKLLNDEINDYTAESAGQVDEDDEFISTVNSLKRYIASNDYWSVADLVSIMPNSALFLTMISSAALEAEIHNMNIDRTVLFANAIDRINGGFENNSSLDREWISPVSEPIASNYAGPEDGKRLLGCIVTSLNYLVGFMEDGVIPNDVPYTDNNLQMVSKSDVDIALNELLESKSFIIDASRRTQAIVLYALIFRLRNQIDNIINSGQTQTIRPVDFNIVRAIAIMADRQDYGEIVDEFLD